VRSRCSCWLARRAAWRLTAMPHVSALHTDTLARGRAAAIHRATAVAAEGADVPLELEKMLAARARAAQLGATGGADLKIALDAIMAGRNCLTLSHLSKQRLLFKLTFVELG